jgi:membrane protein DedA with SNARE-associated domain
MWSQKVREAIALCMALAESKLIKVLEVVEEFISEYRSYILIGLIILVILVIADLLMKWQEKREKKKIEDQMKDK